MRTKVLVLGLGLLVTNSAYGMPSAKLADQVERWPVTENIKIVCEQNGLCFRLRGRRPVARWVYGDGAFYGPGPYMGPGYYGRPSVHTGWW